MESIKVYVTGQAQIDRKLIRLKTMEALHAISSVRPDLLHIFNEFSEPARADLVQFVENNYTYNISLDRMAEMSGRSLSTFNRDFRKAFSVSPHKWIKQNR
jgi:AraC-like DNA-binding protein